MATVNRLSSPAAFRSVFSTGRSYAQGAVVLYVAKRSTGSGPARAPGSRCGEASHYRSSGSQPGAALGPAAGDDRAAGTRAHPDPEAMRLGALTIVRLECTLHDDGS